MKETSTARVYAGSVALVQYAGRLEVVHPNAKATIDPRKLERWLLAQIRAQITEAKK